MKKIISTCAVLCHFLLVSAQNTLHVVVQHATTKEPLAAATVALDNERFVSTNDSGFAQIIGVANGKHNLLVSYAGMETQSAICQLPLPTGDTIKILLEMAGEKMDEIIVQSTRTSRTIANTPTRLEMIDGEELDEKNNMRPANVSMLLHESTGLQVQQTSATTGNSSIRVQGLDGRYTQLLKDGYPNFGNFASGLSILEIAPLDLKQVEVIKGPSSTLYGGGAIAGVVNFISKMPKEKLEADFILNQSNIGQTNVGGYISKRKGKYGFALLATGNLSRAYDVDKDQFSEVPKSKNFTINPRLFYYPSNHTTIMVGTALLKSEYSGGDMEVIKGNEDANHKYFEQNNTLRSTTVFEMEHRLANGKKIMLKESLSFFDRTIMIPGFEFSGSNTNSFTDISYSSTGGSHTIITGANLQYDRFRQQRNDPGIQQNAEMLSAGMYAQDTWDISNKVKLETGLRLDNVRYKNVLYNKNQTFLLPRISALFLISGKLTSRVGAGLGYKTPTIFTEQTEALQYRKVTALGSNIISEKSVGGTADINYKTTISRGFTFSVNQLFFFTAINRPLVLNENSTGYYYFQNATQPVTSKGFETNLKFIYKNGLKLFIGYTYTDAKASYQTVDNQSLVLLPQNKLNITLMYEKEDNFKLGLEGYFTDRQYLSNGNRTPSFWEYGFMAQKTVRKISVFINFENITDQRQSKYKRVVNAPDTNPSFDEIWNHTEGFVLNGGFKFKL